MKILVTGGAGFIGSFIVDELIEAGHSVKIYDNLDPQVHGSSAKTPQHINKEAEFIKADILDQETFYKALKDVDVLFHQAAAVGVGQSMYMIEHYVKQNSLGAASMLDVIVNKKNKLKKIIVASSMSIYGEGKYACQKCGEVSPSVRSIQELKRKEWELKCPSCKGETKPIPTRENKKLAPTSVYAVTKRDHEELFLTIGKAYKLPTVALRYFNAYGPRQALSNPYTGVCAIFSSRLLNGKAPIIYEDGLQSRDFIHVKDLAKANMLAMEKEEADYKTFNVGSGKKMTIINIAKILTEKIQPKKNIKPEIQDTFREGDIRHCFSDISKIKNTLGFTPQTKFVNGIEDLVEWVKRQKCEDKSLEAMEELKKKHLAT